VLNCPGATLTADQLARVAYGLVSSPDTTLARKKVTSVKCGRGQIILHTYYEDCPKEDGVTRYRPEPLHFALASTQSQPEQVLRRHLGGLHDLLGALVGFELLQQSTTEHVRLEAALRRNIPEQCLIEEEEGSTGMGGAGGDSGSQEGRIERNLDRVYDETCLWRPAALSAVHAAGGLSFSVEKELLGCESRCVPGLQRLPSGLLLKSILARLKQASQVKDGANMAIALHSKAGVDSVGGVEWASPGWWAHGDGNTAVAAGILRTQHGVFYEEHLEMRASHASLFGAPPEGEAIPPVVNAIRVHWPYAGLHEPGVWALGGMPQWPRLLSATQDKALGPTYRPHRGALLGLPLSEDMALLMMVENEARIPEAVISMQCLLFDFPKEKWKASPRRLCEPHRDAASCYF